MDLLSVALSSRDADSALVHRPRSWFRGPRARQLHLRSATPSRTSAAGPASWKSHASCLGASSHARWTRTIWYRSVWEPRRLGFSPSGLAAPFVCRWRRRCAPSEAPPHMTIALASTPCIGEQVRLWSGCWSVRVPEPPTTSSWRMNGCCVNCGIGAETKALAFRRPAWIQIGSSPATIRLGLTTSSRSVALWGTERTFRDSLTLTRAQFVLSAFKCRCASWAAETQPNFAGTSMLEVSRT